LRHRRCISVPQQQLQEELERAGAYRVYDDPAGLLRHIDDVGGRR
jgi:hypothetical protein